MNDEFNVYAPKWLWGLLIIFTIMAWTLLYFVATDQGPLVVNGTGILWVDNIIGVAFFIPLIIIPIWTFIRFSSRMCISNVSIKVYRIFCKQKEVYIIQDIIGTKLRGEKYHKDTLQISFVDGQKVTVEKVFTNFDKLKAYLREKDKLA